MMAAQAELGRIVNIYLETIEGFRELNEDYLNADLGSVEREMLAQGMIESTTAELGKWMERWGQRCESLCLRYTLVPRGVLMTGVHLESRSRSPVGSTRRGVRTCTLRPNAAVDADQALLQLRRTHTRTTP